jgi:Heterokaryon incompatibility protein (HET)
LKHFWIDTCCIDKSNNTELSEAINSMFKWYEKATKCYVYLPDVSSRKRQEKDQSLQETWELAFRDSTWFTRGWTLQELLAPKIVEFYSRDHDLLGNKTSLERQIHEITGIAIQALRGTSLSEFGTEERMAWAKSRQTEREEDRAYSLLGIFGVYLPLIYGEGFNNAIFRLQREIHGGNYRFYLLSKPLIRRQIADW